MVFPSMVRWVLDTYSEKGKKRLGMNSYMLDVRTRCDRSQFEFHKFFFFFEYLVNNVPSLSKFWAQMLCSHTVIPFLLLVSNLLSGFTSI